MNTFTPGWLSLAWQIFVTLVALGGGIVGMWASLHFAKRKELARIESSFRDAQKAQDDRLTRIEEKLNQAPSHHDLVELSRRVSDLAIGVANMKGQTEQSNNLLSAIHEHLLKSK